MRAQTAGGPSLVETGKAPLPSFHKTMLWPPSRLGTKRSIAPSPSRSAATIEVADSVGRGVQDGKWPLRSFRQTKLGVGALGPGPRLAATISGKPSPFRSARVT